MTNNKGEQMSGICSIHQHYEVTCHICCACLTNENKNAADGRKAKEYGEELDILAEMLQVVYPMHEIRGVGRRECVAALTMWMQHLIDHGTMNTAEADRVRKAIVIAE